MWKNLIDSNLVKRNFQKIYSRKKRFLVIISQTFRDSKLCLDPFVK